MDIVCQSTVNADVNNTVVEIHMSYSHIEFKCIFCGRVFNYKKNFYSMICYNVIQPWISTRVLCT